MNYTKKIKVDDSFKKIFWKLLKSEKRIRVIGIGTFEIKKVSSKKRYDFETKKVVKTKPFKRIIFRVDDGILTKK